MELTTYFTNRPRGFKAEFAKKLGISPSFLRQIETGYSPIPVYLAKRIEELTNGEISRSELRPDLWDN